NKPGFQKLVFCSAQARQDNLQYFWIDTLRAEWQRAGHLAPNGSALCAHQNHEDHSFYRLTSLDLEVVQGL
ncbi:hypothetical protein F5882DRAFT_313106, partial [Hyaloscypha sp. PMI_1271]